MTNIKLLFSILVPALAAAQIQGPQLGFTSHKGELRRIEGLASSSRLGSVIGALHCSQADIAPGMLQAVCASPEEGTRLVDLRSLAARRLSEATAYERVIWSPNAQAVLVDHKVFSRLQETEWTVAEAPVGAAILALSDRGVLAVWDAEGGGVRFGEAWSAIATEPTAATFDGDALLVATGGGITRLDASGEASSTVELPFAPQAIRAGASGGTVYAASADRAARVALRTDGTADVQVLEFPAALESRAMLLPMAVEGGSSTVFLLSHPAPGSPGWLFRWQEDRGGSITFVPGIPVAEVTEQ
jgi:hypothetical protein